MIISKNNIKIKNISKLLKKKYRDREGKFLIESNHLIEEAKKLNLIIEIFSTKILDGTTLVSEEVIKKISSTDNPPTIVAVCKKWENKTLGNKLVALNNVQDPGNVGTIIRTALAFGFEGIIVQGVDIFNPKVIRSSQGAIFKIPIVQTQDISDYFPGYEIVGSLLDRSATNYKDYIPSKKMILILGNEGNGIEKRIISKLDKKIYIPILFESLNVASCAAILINEYK